MKALALGLLAVVLVACGAAPVARAHLARGASPSPFAWPSPFYSPSAMPSAWPSPWPSPAAASASAASAQRPAPKPSPSHSPSPPPVACTVFPANNTFNKDISTLPVDSHSAAWLASANAGSTNLHPDFGAYPYGIPYNTVTPSHPSGNVTFQYASESDPNPYVVGADLKVEGTPNDGGDDHMLAYDPSACTLEEIYHAQLVNQPYTGGSGAKWNLTSNALRPAGWTSADAAGLPIFPLLVRYSEVQAGFIGHALRFTVKCTNTTYEWPARHEAGTCGTNSGLPPDGRPLPPQEQLQHLRLQRPDAGDTACDAALRDVRRRQREQLVLPGRRELRLDGHPADAAEVRAGVRVRSGRRVVVDGRPELRPVALKRRAVSVEQTLALLAELPERIAAITADLSEDEARTVTPDDRWAATDALAHLRSCADVWGGCISTILAEEHPTIRAINPHTAILGTSYHRQAFRPSFNAYRRQRRELLRQLGGLTPDQWLRTATVVGAGAPLERSVHYYAAWLARHERTHINQFAKVVEAVRA